MSCTVPLCKCHHFIPHNDFLIFTEYHEASMGFNEVNGISLQFIKVTLKCYILILMLTDLMNCYELMCTGWYLKPMVHMVHCIICGFSL